MYLYIFFIRITLNKMTINEDYLINYSSGINKILSQSKIIPILVIDDLDDGLNICEALLKGGINVIEITLRTPNAFKISEKIIRKIPEIKFIIDSSEHDASRINKIISNLDIPKE